MAIIQIKRLINADAPLYTEVLSGQMFGGEENAHQFIISAKRDGEIVPMSGSVFATFINPDGDKVTLTGSMTDNGEATVTLDHDCYAVTGRFEMTIFVTGDDDNTAVYSCRGTVRKTDSETIIDPTHIVPSVERIVAKYGQMEKAVEAANTAASGARAATRSLNFPREAMYAASDTTANPTQAGGFDPVSMIENNDTNKRRTGFRAYSRAVLFNLASDAYKYFVWITRTASRNSRLYSPSNGEWVQGSTFIPHDGKYFRVCFARVDEADITEADVTAMAEAITVTELTDKSLSIDGAIADAKTVGEALESVAAGPMDRPTISLSMFQTVGVIGDSFASGHLDATSGDNYAQSWVQVLARHYGFDAANYSCGGIKAAEWLTHANGLSKMQADIPRQLYFIALGVNDATAGTDLTAFKSTLTEIADDVRAHSQNAVLCFVTLARLGTSANPAAYLPYSNAIAEVATAVGGLLIRSEALPVVDSTFWPRYSGHPTAPEYAALAEAYDRAFEDAALASQATLDSFNSTEAPMSVRALESDAAAALTWEQGSLSSASGATTDSTTRCRTISASAPQATSDLGFILTVPAGFKAYIYTYIGVPNTTGYAGAYINAWQTGTVSIVLPTGRYINIVGAKTDDSAVTPSDMTGFTLTRRGYTDRTLTQGDKAADAKAVGDRLAELEDQIAEAAASTEPYKCVQRIANASPTTTGPVSSMTVIDGKLFVFKYATGNEDVTGCKKYTINSDGTLDTSNTGTFSSNLGHANTVDWNAGNECLITTRTPQTGDVTPESKIYIIPNVTGETTSFDRTATGVVGIDIDTTIVGGGEQVFGEYRVNAVWAFDNVMKNDMIYVISDDSSSTTSGLRRLALLQLGKGTNQMQYGTLISGAEAAEFNGTFNVLGVWTQAWQRVSGISQGDNDMQFWGGKLYELAAPTGVNGFPMMIHEITEWGTEWETRRILIPQRPGSGSSSSWTWEKEGIAIYKHHMYLGTHSAGLWVYEF